MLPDFIIGVLLAFIVSGLAYYKQWLSRSGLVAATLLGGIIWGIGTWHSSLPLLLFFVSSSLLSLSDKKTAGIDEKENTPRDAVQVVCNGAVAAVTLVLYALSGDWIFMLGYWASLAISTADTWSSAIGTRYASMVIDITTGRKLAKGLSGGISTIGTLAGMLGSFIVAVAGWIMYSSSFPLMLITVVGFSGMLLDSLLGSMLQVKYVQEDGRQLESVNLTKGAFTQKGIRWINNDIVNILSNLVAVSLLLIYLKYG